MAAPKHTQSLWVKTPTPNLIRYSPAGTYYLRARFGGGPVRESLETDDYSTAKIRLKVRMEVLRGTPGRQRAKDAPTTLPDALSRLADQVRADPSIKPGSVQTFLEQLRTLGAERKGAVPTTPLRSLSAPEMQAWWRRTADACAPQRANHLLMWVKRAFKLARKLGAPHREPAEDLKRVKIPRTRLTLLKFEQFRQVLDTVRRQRSRFADEAADWLEMMCYGGPRPGEVKKLWCEDLDDESDIIIIWGMPIKDRMTAGTKNSKSRRVPMTAAMKGLVARIRKRWRSEGRRWTGPLFRMFSPWAALRNACQKLGFPHQRLYDLRHAFATACAKSGVDVPTFAGWLGHSDGGALAMRTYVHPDEEHGKRAVKKVKF